jgi:hypothetical protein
MNPDLNENVQHHQILPARLIDEVSSTEYYIGTSRSFSDETKGNWRIQKIYKIGSVWKFGFPDGDQSFMYIWSGRFGYIYKQ